MNMTTLAVVFLAMIATGGVAYVLIYPYLSGDSRGAKRHKAMIEPNAPRRTDRGAGVNRRESVAQSLKELEKKEKAARALTLELRIAHAGLNWSKNRYYITCLIVGLVIGLPVMIVAGSVLMALFVAIAAGAGLPMFMLNFRRNRRLKQFQEEFPNAIDVIVRGVKSGLPLGDCLKIISVEAAEPVRSEFKKIIEAQSVGMSMGEACGKLYKSMPTSEANFFGIVVQIQSKTGGSLSEAFGNLSKVLRERKKMKGKINALSMEAKASAPIIGALPFIVTALVSIMTPQYMMFMFTTQTGKIMIAGSLFWMFLGVMMMRKMIRFDF